MPSPLSNGELNIGVIYFKGLRQSCLYKQHYESPVLKELSCILPQNNFIELRWGNNFCVQCPLRFKEIKGFPGNQKAWWIQNSSETQVYKLEDQIVFLA